MGHVLDKTRERGFPDSPRSGLAVMGWRRSGDFAVREFGAALGEEGPGFAVGFVAVTGLFGRRDQGAQHGHVASSLAQQQDRRDQVPDTLRNDVGGEHVDIIEGVVVLCSVVGHELAAISGARPHGCRFHLDTEKIRDVLDADVVGLRVSPRLCDGETALGGFCHELEFDPFAALFEAAESIPVVLDAFLPAHLRLLIPVLALVLIFAAAFGPDFGQ